MPLFQHMIDNSLGVRETARHFGVSESAYSAAVNRDRTRRDGGAIDRMERARDARQAEAARALLPAGDGPALLRSLLVPSEVARTGHPKSGAYVRMGDRLGITAQDMDEALAGRLPRVTGEEWRKRAREWRPIEAPPADPREVHCG